MFGLSTAKAAAALTNPINAEARNLMIVLEEGDRNGYWREFVNRIVSRPCKESNELIADPEDSTPVTIRRSGRRRRREPWSGSCTLNGNAVKNFYVP
jgi:hypothetical protein